MKGKERLHLSQLFKTPRPLLAAAQLEQAAFLSRIQHGPGFAEELGRCPSAHWVRTESGENANPKLCFSWNREGGRTGLLI